MSASVHSRVSSVAVNDGKKTVCAEKPETWSQGASDAIAEKRSDHPNLNRLLGALPEDVYERLHPDLELVPLSLGKVIYEAHDALSHVYFPTTAIVSLLP